MKKTSPEKEVPKHRSGKNTRKWCKGKIGKEHHYTWKSDKDFYGIKLLQYTCDFCGKIERVFYNFDEKWYETPTVGSSEPLKKKEKQDEPI